MNPSALTGPLRASTVKPPDDWQREAAQAWLASRHPTRGPGHGIVEAATGLGKTILAMACMVEASRLHPELRFVVVVPNRELMSQWVDDLREWFGLGEGAVGRLGDRRRDALDRHRFLVAVIDSARRHLPESCRGHRVMLVVDECHASASPQNRAIYQADTVFRLGISATARVAGETDEHGILLPLERQPHALELGPPCYRMDFARADRLGLLPPFRIVHHGLLLSTKAARGAASEAERYEQLTHALKNAIQEAQEVGVVGGMVHAILRHPSRWSPRMVEVAEGVHNAARARKQFLFLLPGRNRIAAALVAEALDQARGAGTDLQVLLFNERVRMSEKEADRELRRAERTVEFAELDIDEEDDDAEPLAPTPFDFQGAARLHELLEEAHRAGRLAIDGPTEKVIRGTYSGREDAGAVPAMKLAAGQSGRARVLVTAKAANQGINLPNVDMGVIVASPASILRRVQTLGRILRARREGGGLIPREAYGRYFPKTLHVIYVKGTADEEIYLQTDWDELLGRERNEWRVWAPDADAPVVDDQPPTPPMSEDEGVAWVREQLAAGATFPILWPTRLPPHQPLTFKHHHVRVTGEGGKVGRGSPVVANDAEIQRIVDGVAARRRLDPVALRGPLFVTVRDRLVLRIANEGLIDRPAVDPRSGRPLSPPLVVMGQLAALPVVTEAGAEPPDAELSRTEHPAPRPAPRGVPEPRGSNANLWVSAVAAFLDTGGAPNPEPPAAPPAVYTLLQDGARAARLPPVDRPMAARPEHLFAAWARAVALGDVAVAEAMETELGRRMAGEAREYALALRLVRAT